MKLRVTTTQIFDMDAVQKEIEGNENSRERPVWRRFIKEIKKVGYWKFFNRKPKNVLEWAIRNRFKVLLDLNTTYLAVNTEQED